MSTRVTALLVVPLAAHEAGADFEPSVMLSITNRQKAGSELEAATEREQYCLTYSWTEVGASLVEDTKESPAVGSFLTNSQQQSLAVDLKLDDLVSAGFLSCIGGHRYRKGVCEAHSHDEASCSDMGCCVFHGNACRVGDGICTNKQDAFLHLPALDVVIPDVTEIQEVLSEPSASSWSKLCDSKSTNTGAVLGVTNAADFVECQSACDSKKSCHMINFREHGNKCHFFAAPAITPDAKDCDNWSNHYVTYIKGVVGAAKELVQTVPEVSPAQWSKLCDSRSATRGEFRGLTSAPDAAACQTTCDWTDACNMVHYRTLRRKCFLFSGPTAGLDADDCDATSTHFVTYIKSAASKPAIEPCFLWTQELAEMFVDEQTAMGQHSEWKPLAGSRLTPDALDTLTHLRDGATLEEILQEFELAGYLERCSD